MTSRPRPLLIVFALLATVVSASAQTVTDPAAHLASMITGRAAEIRGLRAKSATTPLTSDENAKSTISLTNDFEPIYLRIYLSLTNASLLALEERRADKQVGDAGGSTAGSTSLVSKGGTPAILALAVENGALTQDVSGTTVTFRGSPVSIVKSLGKTGYFQTLKTDDDTIRYLQKVSFAASFDTSRGVAEGAQPTFTGERSQFSAASARISAVDHKDPRAAVNDRRWNEFATTTLADLDKAATDSFTAMRADPGIDAWLVETREAIAAASLDDIEDVIVARFRALGAVAVAPATTVTIRQAGQAFATMLKRRADVLEEIAGGGQLVFDWSYQRPVTGPQSSNFKIVGSVGRSVLLTGNGSVTLYHGDLAAGAERVRDIQVAAELDVPFGDSQTIGRYVLTLATKIQHMPKDVEAAEGTLFPGTKGTIWLGQLKVTIPVKGTAAKIPVSVTLANRTELISEDKLFARAQVGLSYDLDAILARFRP